MQNFKNPLLYHLPTSPVLWKKLPMYLLQNETLVYYNIITSLFPASVILSLTTILEWVQVKEKESTRNTFDRAVR